MGNKIAKAMYTSPIDAYIARTTVFFGRAFPSNPKNVLNKADALTPNKKYSNSWLVNFSSSPHAQRASLVSLCAFCLYLASLFWC